MGFETHAAAAARLRILLVSTSDAALRRTLHSYFPDVTMPNELGGSLFPECRSDALPTVRHADLVHAELPYHRDDRPFATAARSPRPPAVASVEDDSELPPFTHELGALLAHVFTTPDVAAELMASASAQARALALVWDAHRCGAITLPDGIARLVLDARARVPGVCAPVKGG